MYIANKILGIGKIVNENENSYIVYFEEVDKTKEMLKSLVKVYETEDAAEAALNTEMSDDKKREIYACVKKEEEEWKEVSGASERMSEINHEMAKKLYYNR